MLSLFNQLVRSKSGNFSQMMAVLAVPLIGAVGLGVDYTEASRIRSQLFGAADAAATGSIAMSSPASREAATLGTDGPIPSGAEDAINLFNAYVLGEPGIQIDKIEADVRKKEADLTSKVTFTANIPMMFISIFGYDHITVSGEATATRRAPFMDFYLLLDNTPSMGVGATTADIDKMVANTPDKCAFACHDLSTTDNYYNLAKQLGVAMRIDVVRQATQQLTTKAAERRAHANQFRMALYTFGDAATNMKLTRLQTLTNDMSKVKQSACGVDLMTIPKQNYYNDQLTSFDDTFAALDKEIGTPGDGSNANERQKIVFFVSDGVGDSYKPSNCTEPTMTGGSAGRCQEPIDYKRVCKSLKDRGVKVAVLYTTYLPLPDNKHYNKWIAPFEDQIGPKMADCATPGYFFEVSPSQGIAEALEALFLKVINVPRLAG